MSQVNSHLTDVSAETQSVRRRWWARVAPRPVLLLLLAVALAAAAHVNTVENPFAFDDRTEILENPSIRGLGDVGLILRHNVTRPVVNLSYAVDYAVWELNRFGYHVTNLLLHLGNVVLLFALVRRFARDLEERHHAAHGLATTATAFTAAALFAVHPMLTEAVGYVSGRSELLSAALFLGSLYLFRVGMFRLDWRWLAGGGALFVLALGAKETAVMLPAVLFAVEVLIVGGSREARRWRLWHVHAPLLTAVLVAAAARIWLYAAVEHPDAAGVTWPNVLVNLHVAVRYISLLVVPASQSIVHHVTPIESLLDARVLTAAAVFALVGTVGAVWRKQEPLVTLGIVWFFLLLAPSSALILLADRAQPMAEHRVYLASCGFFMAVAATALRASGLREQAESRRRVTAAAVLGLVLAGLTGLTVARNRIWADPVRLWEDAVRKAPFTYMSHYGLADAYRSIGDCESAGPAYERALRIRPQNVDAYLGLAECLTELGRSDDARTVLRLGIERSPMDARVRLALAALEESRRNPAEALRFCRDVLAVSPGNATAEACVVRNQEALDGR